MEFNKPKTFVEFILERIEGMCGVNTQEKNGEILISKEGYIFAKIVDDKLKLLVAKDKFIIVKKTVIEDRDELLKTATNAFWIASDRIK